MPALFRKGLWMVLGLLVAGGCSYVDRSNTIEEISPVVLLYLEEGEEDGSLKMSTIIPPLRKEKKSLVTTTSNTITAGSYLHNLKYHRETKGGQIRIIFFAEDLAKRGLFPLLDTLQHDPEISSRVFLAVVKGDMIGYLTNQLFRGQEQLDLYLYKMFAHYEKQGQLTTSNLHEFLSRLYNPYADPILPYYTVQNHELHYAGTALFCEDRIVGVTSLPDDVFFQMLRKKGSVQKMVSLPEENVVLGSIKTWRKVKVDDSLRKVRIEVTLKGRLEEIPSRQRMTNLQEWRELEGKLEQKIEEKLKRAVHQAQSLAVDPFGLGLYTVTWTKRTLTDEQWKQRWPELDVDIHVSLKLENTGMVKSNAAH